MGAAVGRRGALAAAMAAGLALGALALPAAAFRDDVVLVSRATPGTPANGSSSEPAISADGRLVAFTSFATVLSDDDDDDAVDVFVRDLEIGATTLVSRAGGADGPGGTADSGAPAISADGRHVAFASFADDLAAGDADASSDVFVRDLVAGTTTLASRAGGAGGAGGDGGSFTPAISADGRYVAFASLATNLSPDDQAGFDVFVRDLVAGTTTLVSRADGAAGAAGTGPSTAPSISGDGRRVAFASGAGNLSADDIDAVSSRVLVRDLDAATTTLVSRADGAAGAPAGAPALAPAISGGGRHVAFESSATGLSDADADAVSDVFVRDLDAGTTTLVSRGPGPTGAGGDGNSTAAAISADGRRIAFASAAGNLSGADADGLTDVFLRDAAAAATILVSRAPGAQGRPADSGSRDPALTSDGVLVAFATEADNLAPEGDRRFTNVVRRDVLGVPAPSPPPPAAPPAPETPPAPAATPPVAVAVARCAGVRATIVGTAGRDVIRGTRGRDVIAALGGDDVVRGGGGADMICLGPGDDRALGGAGDDALLGGAGADRLDGGAGRDLVRGGAGRDRLVGGAGTDRLIGGAGRDVSIGGRGRDICRAERRFTCEVPVPSGRLR